MRARLLLLLPLAALPLVLACGDKDADDTGSENWFPHCDATETALAFDELSPLGFSAADLATTIGSEIPAQLTWAEGGSTPLTLGLAWSSGAVFVDLEEAVPPDDVTAIPSIGVICDDYVRVGATLSLATEDGLLAETIGIDLAATQADAASFSLGLAEADFSHAEIFASFYDDAATTQGPTLSGSFLDGRSEGELSWWSEGSDSETAWAATDPVATWTSAVEGR